MNDDRKTKAQLIEELKELVGAKDSEHILVVDDERAQRFILTLNLKRLGYGVSEASNGHEAVALFAASKRAGRESPCDLVILDMTMEVGFDGLDTYKAILELYPGQKALISSGFDHGRRIRTAKELGADSLAKPYPRDLLAEAVRHRLDRD